jgi:hypothetical protein
MRAAILSSASRFPSVILRSALMVSTDSPARKDMIDQLIATAVGSGNEKVEMLTLIAPLEGKTVEPWQLAALGGLLDSLHRRGQDLDSFAASASAALHKTSRLTKPLGWPPSACSEGVQDSSMPTWTC